MLRLLPLVLGAFAIGAETFLITGVLPEIAADLHVTAAAAGSLVTIFAIAYAFGSPLIAVATAGVERKRLLIGAIFAFALANLVAAAAPNFFSLAAARVLLALAAGTFMPAAVAFATALFSAEHRGRAIALIYAGMTLATVVGVPAGTYLASIAGWRAPFFGVAGARGARRHRRRRCAAALTGLRAAGFAERLAVHAPRRRAADADAHRVGAGRPVRRQHFHRRADRNRRSASAAIKLALALVFFGVVSFIGSQFGGYAADRWPRERFLDVGLRRPDRRLPADVARPAHRRRGRRGAAVRRHRRCGACSAGRSRSSSRRGWSRLDPAMAPITLSLNVSALYVGVAIGSSLGAWTIARWSVDAIGLVAGADRESSRWSGWR